MQDILDKIDGMIIIYYQCYCINIKILILYKIIII